MKIKFPQIVFAFSLLFFSCKQNSPNIGNSFPSLPFEKSIKESIISEPIPEPKDKVARAAMQIIDPNIDYDPTYFVIPYPMGDVPSGKGVCTDVVIRTYRKLGIDLQEEVHKDMQANFSLYPKIWGLKTTDTNIDHRRVPNLMKFFDRHGKTKPRTSEITDYAPGDIVSWDLGGGITHIGIVVEEKSFDSKRYLVVHNMGSGQIMEDILFRFKIIGHHRYKF